MQEQFKFKRLAILVIPVIVMSLFSATSFATTKVKTTHKSGRSAGQFGDSIAAIVDTDVITQRQLLERMAGNRISSGDDRGRQQVLQDMIDESLMRDEADRLGISVSNARMQEALQSIAARNNMTIEQLRKVADQQKINWDNYVQNLHDQLLMEELRGQILAKNINITEGDIDAYLKQNPTGVAPDYKLTVIQGEAPQPERRVLVERTFEPKAIAFKHIYVRVPDGASDAVVEEARKKANEALRKIRSGSSFESVAREYSDGQEASAGGDLGIRMFENWPELFVTVTKNVRDGRTSGVFKAANGFHILKVVERRGLIREKRREVMVQPPRQAPVTVVDPRVKAARSEGSVDVVESKVSHILIKITPVFSDQQAQQRIAQIQQQIQSGMSFEDAAKKYSQDSSAPLGGDIGWVMPGMADPNLQKSIDALQPGQISQPVRSAFGWHLIKLVDRRTEDKKTDIRRDLAREALYTERANAVLQDWVAQLRSRAYIDNRITGQISSRN